METAERLTPQERRKARRNSILSSCWGALAPATVQDSAIIILFASALGAGDMLSMATTSAQSIGNFLLLIPVACLAGRLGYKATLVATSLIGALAMAFVAAAPLAGDWSRAVLLVSIWIFSLCMATYVAAWFPLSDGFLLQNERSRYFGTMRFCWQSFTALFLFVCGLAIDRAPSRWTLQTIILITALGLLGRAFYDSRLPHKHLEKEETRLGEGLKEAIANKPLSGFSVYICFLYLAANSTLPLAFLHLKKSLGAPDSLIVILSSLSLAGMMAGYLLAGRIIDAAGVKRALLSAHFVFAAVNLFLAFAGGGSAAWLAAIALALTLFGFCHACASIAISTEMMALASPGNKAISMAYCGSFLGAGMGGSRLLTSLALGSGMLAPLWRLGGVGITLYQTLFLLSGVFILFVCLLLVLVPGGATDAKAKRAQETWGGSSEGKALS